MVMNKYKYYMSDDPLDLGESLWITHWFPNEVWSDTIATRAMTSLENLWNKDYFEMPVKYRLAFREFGTTLGVQAHPLGRDHWKSRVNEINSFWSKNLYSRDNDITPVMFCASLIPGVWIKSYDTKLRK